MDADVREVLIAAIPVLGGIAVAVLVAKITADRTMDLERAKWKRELYATFLHASDEVRDGVRLVVDGLGPRSDRKWGGIEAAQKALWEIQMLSPNIGAGAVWTAAGTLMKDVLHLEAAEWLEEGGAVVPIDRSNWAALDAAYLAARRDFVAAAARELG